MKSSVTYFEQKGKENTKETLELAKERAIERGIRTIVVASTHGYTALEAAKVFSGLDVSILAVTISAGFADEGWRMTEEEKKQITQQGVSVLTTHMAFGGGIEDAFGEASPQSIVAQTYYTFSQGVKVAAEITIMAAEADCLDLNQDVIAIAGTNGGADTAIVVKPAYARHFKDLRIKEIICKPQEG